ncbi:hypothetical protein IE53DRAFT_118209 [Violaceomyces palustris]|uniref:Uncharacterized protein n=1 Tax=Violaceomyces palustris TaxID=1673888 RepID=A0ACD0NW25_9BASI|nr:hypothetical protein IE53DRAFT_118209 [Violaceomyces palustris]
MLAGIEPPPDGTPELTHQSDEVTTSSSSIGSLPSRIDSPLSYRRPSSQALRKVHTFTHRSTSPDYGPTPSRVSDDPSSDVRSEHTCVSTRFDSLHDLLEKAGYKETRVITPDRKRLELSTSSSDSSSTRPHATNNSLDQQMQGKTQNCESKSGAEALLRRKMQAGEKKLPGSSNRRLKSVKSSGWLSSFWMNNEAEEESPLPPPPHPVLPSTSTPESVPAVLLPASKSLTDALDQQSQNGPSTRPNPLGRQGKSREPRSPLKSGQSNVNGTPGSLRKRGVTKMASPRRTLRKKGSSNQLWIGSMVHRSGRSSTLPSKARVVAKVFNSSGEVVEATGEEEAFVTAAVAVQKKARPSLVGAFAQSPPKLEADTGLPKEDDPVALRKRRQERAAWRESLSGLQAFSETLDKRRVLKPASGRGEVDTEAWGARGDGKEIPRPVPSMLVSKVANPVVSKDAAVALRNEACLRPVNLSVKRMKSVEVLARALQPPPSIRTGEGAKPAEGSPPNLKDGNGPPIAPAKPNPPRLTISSPRGITSPKVLDLKGQEFEPRSYPQDEALIISSRRVATKKKLSKKTGSVSEASAGTSTVKRKSPSRSRTTKESIYRDDDPVPVQGTVGTRSTDEDPSHPTARRKGRTPLGQANVRASSSKIEALKREVETLSNFGISLSGWSKGNETRQSFSSFGVGNKDDNDRKSDNRNKTGKGEEGEEDPFTDNLNKEGPSSVDLDTFLRKLKQAKVIQEGKGKERPSTTIPTHPSQVESPSTSPSSRSRSSTNRESITILRLGDKENGSPCKLKSTRRTRSAVSLRNENARNHHHSLASSSSSNHFASTRFTSKEDVSRMFRESIVVQSH